VQLRTQAQRERVHVAAAQSKIRFSDSFKPGSCMAHASCIIVRQLVGRQMCWVAWCWTMLDPVNCLVEAILAGSLSWRKILCAHWHVCLPLLNRRSSHASGSAQRTTTQWPLASTGQVRRNCPCYTWSLFGSEAHKQISCGIASGVFLEM